MKSSNRNLLLIPSRGAVNNKRRYFNLKNAVRSATVLALDARSGVTIYDTERGVDVVKIHQINQDKARIDILSLRLFRKLWSQA